MKTNDPAAVRLGTECIRVACFSLPFHSIVYNFNNYLMAVKRLRFCNIYSFLIECGNIVPITFFALRIIGYQGAWISRVVSMLGLSVLAVMYIYLNKQGKSFRDKMLLLPDSFGISPDHEISIIATSADEILDLSHIAIAFAMEHGADKKRAMTFGLITEELSVNLTEHGIDDGKPHNINARLVAKDEDLIIRKRDDCKPFNLTEYYRHIQENTESDKELSLSIIMKMAKDVKYTATFGANNLIVRI